MITPIIKQLGQQAYQETWDAMRQFTDHRLDSDPDQIWLLEHPPIFTQGQAGKPEHIIELGDIPLVKTDRGGQITYHGPGQLVIYFLLNLKRLNIGIRTLVSKIEGIVIQLLEEYGIKAYAKCDAPGVYIQEAKIASIGLRVRKGCTYHGLALNLDMDLSPFLRINPCGYRNLRMTQLKDHVLHFDRDEVEARVVRLCSELSVLCTHLKA